MIMIVKCAFDNDDKIKGTIEIITKKKRNILPISIWLFSSCCNPGHDKKTESVVKRRE